METNINKNVTDINELSSILPEIKRELEFLNSGDFKKYEDSVNKATLGVMGELTRIINDGSLALDPEQLVRAADVLAKSKIAIQDSKRKLLETLLKGEVMYKAIEPPKTDKNNNVLEEYIKRTVQTQSIASANSVFAEIENGND